MRVEGDPDPAKNGVYYLHSDHLDSASLTTDAGGSRVGELRYTPYGVTRQGYPIGNVPTDRRFTGQTEIASIGLYDYGTRMYSPSLGRFLSADTLVPEPGNPQSLNRYAYVYHNPLRYTDPSGHWVETAWDIISIGWDIYEVYRDPGNAWNWVALAVDVGAAVLPAVPAGAGLIVRGGKAAKAAVEVASHADEVVDVARLGSRAEDFTKIVHIPGARTLLKNCSALPLLLSREQNSSWSSLSNTQTKLKRWVGCWKSSGVGTRRSISS